MVGCQYQMAAWILCKGGSAAPIRTSTTAVTKSMRGTTECITTQSWQ